MHLLNGLVQLVDLSLDQESHESSKLLFIDVARFRLSELLKHRIVAAFETWALTSLNLVALEKILSESFDELSADEANVVLIECLEEIGVEFRELDRVNQDVGQVLNRLQVVDPGHFIDIFATFLGLLGDLRLLLLHQKNFIKFLSVNNNTWEINFA